MVKNAPYQGVYGLMEFDDYKFQEYPKVVGYADDKKTSPIIVKDAKEEIAFISTGAPGAKRSLEDELRDDLIRKELELEQAREQLEKMKAAAAEIEREREAAEKAKEHEKLLAQAKEPEEVKTSPVLPPSAKVPGK